MARIGIIGLGMMGRTHYESWGQVQGAQVVAIADCDAERARGHLAGTGGNVLAGGLTRLPMERIRGYGRWQELIADPAVEIVDICLPTPLHRPVAVAALEAGKHVVCEKPLGRTRADAEAIAAAAARARGAFMPAMCMRFWPGWQWLQDAVRSGRYGAVRSASFHRLSSMPGGWYADGEASGGALLDLHIHDVDMVLWLFGPPQAVVSRGVGAAPGIAHVTTQYRYDRGPVVSAEGGWAMAPGFGFRMRYTVNFAQATADFDLGRTEPLLLAQDGRQEAIALAPGAGYVPELAYFHGCIARGERPTVVTAADGVWSVRVCEAEAESIRTGAPVAVAAQAARSP